MENQSGVAGCSRCQDVNLESDRLRAKCDHLSSQNNLMALALEDSKSMTNRLSVLLGKHEANSTAMHLVINYSDYLIESFDVLVALLENPTGLKSKGVAKHLLSRLEKSSSYLRSDSGLGGSLVSGKTDHPLDTTWDSSGYSQTAR